jgi:hypothetical protein
VAVVLIARVAIAVAESPVGRAAAVWVASGGSTYFGSIEKGVRSAIDYYERQGRDAAEAQDMLNSADGPEDSPGWVVTDFAAPFELRKLQWRISRAPAGGVVEDVAVMTFHFIKSAGGTPGTYVDSTDLPAVETAVGTYWTSIKPQYHSMYHSDMFRWYKDGPAFYSLNGDGTAYVPNGSNPAIRVTDVDVPGTNAASNQLPPQVAFTITEKTSSRRHWGRYYLPAMNSSLLDANGRVSSANVTARLAEAVTFYNSCRAASMVPVVFCIQKPSRPTAGGGTLPVQAAVAYEVLSLQMDDLADVIRSRRWDTPTIRSVTTLT